MRSLQKFVCVIVLLAGLQSIVSGAVWTVSPWTDDASTGLDSAKTYTHAINNNGTNDGTVTVNGVVFDNENNSGSVGQGWTLSGGLWADETSVNITGDSAALALNTRFHYYVTEMVLYGLTPGAVYELTLFSVAWEDGTREVTLTDTYGSFTFNQDEYGNNNGIKIVGLYSADANGELHLGLVSDFHIYAFANCEYTDDLPVVVSPVVPAEFEGGNRVGTDTVLTWAEEFTGSLANPAFDVYMDPNETFVTNLDPIARVSSKQSAFSFDPDLDPNTLYYWSVATYLDMGDSDPNQATPVRSFRTEYVDEHWTDSAWTDDSNSGISAGKTYTHKVNFNASEAASTYVNGVYFENDSDRMGANWSLTNAGNSAGGSHYVAGDGGALVTNMYYGDPVDLTLTGLTPGVDYVLTQYTRGWGPVGGRKVHHVTSADGRTTTLDGNIDGDGNGHLFMYSYTAPASGQLVITFDALGADSWHHYAFSNEVATAAYVDPTPLPGASVGPDVVLEWGLQGTVTNPTYNVVVATDQTLTTVVDSVSGLSATSFDPVIDPEVTYYWQVEIVEDGGPVIYTSPVWAFTTTPPPPATKVMEWKFDETTGIIAEQTAPSPDADGVLVNFNDPNTPGISHVAGLVNNGLLLNGKDEYVDVSDAQPYMPTADGQSFAISGYIRTFDDFGPLFSMRNAADENPIIDIALGADGVQTQPGRVCLLVRDDAGSLSYVNSGITVNDGRWHNFIVTRVDGKWMLYIDGVLRGTINGAATGNVNLDLLAMGTSLKWVIDGWNPDNTHLRDFKGILDEYTIWDGELQPYQIAELAAIVPPPGDLNFDMDTDIDDLTDLAGRWLASSWTPVQPTDVLEDMETYTHDPNSFKNNWAYTPEEDSFGILALSVIPDPNGLYGQVMQMDYNFNGKLHAHVPVILPNRGANMGLYDRVEVRLKKLPGCDSSRIILDFYDGRDKVNPTVDQLYEKGRITIDIDQAPVDEWVTVSGMIPGNDPDLRTCTDLYRIMFSIQDGGEDVGTLLVDSIELADGTEDCIPVIGQLVPDMNGDCNVDLLDYAELAEGWLSGI